MRTIKQYLSNDHRKCDDLFATMEQSANKSLKDAKDAFLSFKKETLHHFNMEEKVMFLEFETKTGMVQGPTAMMKHEHAQMRALIEQMQEAIDLDDKDKFFGLSETLMMLLQQHNMKEEQMLYPMAEQHLSEQSQQIIEMMDSLEKE